MGVFALFSSIASGLKGLIRRNGRPQESLAVLVARVTARGYGRGAWFVMASGVLSGVLASFWFSEQAGSYMYGVYLAGAGFSCGAGFAIMTIHVQFKRSVALDSETAGQPVDGTGPERLTGQEADGKGGTR